MIQEDPNGKSAHEPGAKLDAHKSLAGLVLGDFAPALERVADVGTYGANKYTKSGWKSVPQAAERYYDALWRHLLRDAMGEVVDVESGLSHKAHIAWNALAVLYFAEQDKLARTYVCQ